MLIENGYNSLNSEQMFLVVFAPIFQDDPLKSLYDSLRNIANRYFFNNHFKYFKAINCMIRVDLVDVLKTIQNPSVRINPTLTINIEFL